MEAATAVSLAATRLQGKDSHPPPLRVSSSHLQETDLSSLALLLESFGQAHVVDALREKARIAPPMPPGKDLENLRAVRLPPPPTTPARQDWLSPVCWGRDRFLDTVLVFPAVGSVSYYKFLWATQNPLSSGVPAEAAPENAATATCSKATTTNKATNKNKLYSLK